MPSLSDYTRAHYCDQDCLDDVLTKGGLSLDVRSSAAAPLNVEIGFRQLQCASAVNVSGDRTRVCRGSREISRDDGGFLGVLFQRTGYTCLGQREQQQIVRPGEITVWHGRRTLDFRMPEPFHKFCLLVPIARFEALLPEAELHTGAHFRAGSSFSRLLGACLATLSDNVLARDEERGDAAVDLTLEMLGAALTKNKESQDEGRRTTLLQRIRVFIERRLDDSELSPATIARAHNISVRYLHLLFSERGVTVGGWLRSRRLARCRVELRDRTRDRTITEIALKWGFSDVAHFSRSFKVAFGMSPNAFRGAKVLRGDDVYTSRGGTVHGATKESALRDK